MHRSSQNTNFSNYAVGARSVFLAQSIGPTTTAIPFYTDLVATIFTINGFKAAIDQFLINNSFKSLFALQCFSCMQMAKQ